MMTLQQLQEKNPGLKLYSVLDPAFSRYGRILEDETVNLASALDTTEIPAVGNCYQSSVPVLEAVDLMPRILTRGASDAVISLSALRTVLENAF